MLEDRCVYHKTTNECLDKQNQHTYLCTLFSNYRLTSNSFQVLVAMGSRPIAHWGSRAINWKQDLPCKRFTSFPWCIICLLLALLPPKKSYYRSIILVLQKYRNGNVNVLIGVQIRVLLSRELLSHINCCKTYFAAPFPRSYFTENRAILKYILLKYIITYTYIIIY